MNFVMKVVNDYEEAKELVAEGWCPIEASYGEGSVVDGLLMDHHGEYSGQEPVSVRAYRDHFAARAEDPRFFCAGEADADATFAAAALAGMIPGGDPDWLSLATTIGLMDTNPIGLCVPDLPHGGLLLLWYTLAGNRGRNDAEATTLARIWPLLMSDDLALLIGTCEAKWHARYTRLENELQRCEILSSRWGVALDGAEEWGFDVWYGRIPVHPPENPEGWENPFVISRDLSGNIVVGCPNAAVAEALFGPGGLKNVFDKLKPKGWGGREAVGGSPRGQRMTREDLARAFEDLGDLVHAKKEGK